uniref:NADH-ubiquinone oxidoreductase chain 2 n=1 Tax=Caryopemon giganteus TaxID=2758555 RepID=A0A7D6V4G7_9CUCU|nr:NADH dehydrogenase subunit 2 [Caryopemon giganteus]QLX47622.1 NADH dehydrogenase subunit 2 [Caryopemon giganteus]
MLALYKILFSCTLILGTLMAISSYSWLSIWVGLEINLLSIIPLLINYKNSYPSEAAMKYFITQALASMLLLMSVILSMNLNESLPMDSFKSLIMILDSSLFIKMGAAPFHAWFPEVIEGINWTNSMILLTWQKLAPMVILMYNINLPLFLSWIVLFSSIIGGIYGMNQTSLRKILAYSSINHVGWMLSSMLNMNSVWFIYFLIYSIISANLIIIFWFFKIYFTKQLYLIFSAHKINGFTFALNFLSLGGLPPFLGFLPKWITVNFLVYSEFYWMTIILIMSTLITLFFYIRLTFSAMMISQSEMILYPNTLNNPSIFILNSISLMGLVTSTMILNIF